jgi:hypothetical protein
MRKKIFTIIAFIIITILFVIPASSSNINIISNSENIDNSNKELKSKNLNLELGDIVWRWVDADLFPLFQFFMHPLMVTDIVGNDYEFIEANGAENVWIRFETEEWIVNNNIFDFVYRLKDDVASYSDIEAAISFAKSQEGKKFAPLFDLYTGIFHYKNANPDDPNDPLSDEWYCTELIWAAYYTPGIDIDSNQGYIVLPIDIHLSPLFDKVDLVE